MSIFPLTFTGFEHYMLVEDSPAYPMSFFVQLRLSEVLLRHVFTQALKAVLVQHPLLRAHVNGSAASTTSRLTWIDAGLHQPFISWGAEGDPILCSHRHIDLRSETGIRLWVRTDHGTTRVLMQFHHSCCDGIGALHFVEDMLGAYRAAQSSPQVNAPQEPGAESVRDRDQSRIGWLQHLARVPKDLVQITKFFATTPAPLACAAGQVSDETYLPALSGFSHTFNDWESERIHVAARRLGVTINDLLLRDLFFTLRDWNSSRSPRGTREPIRIAIPMNQRSPTEERMTAVNAVSIVYLDRSPGRLADPTGFLAGVHGEMEDIKYWHMGATLTQVLGLVGAIPGGLLAFVKSKYMKSTSLLSNLGVLDARSLCGVRGGRSGVGDGTLDGVEFYPP